MVGQSYLDEICKDLKNGVVNNDPVLSDKTGAYVYTPAFKNALDSMTSITGDVLDHKKISALQIPNTVVSLSCYAWMSSYFDLMGDKIPNSDEIHLEPVCVKDIYVEVSYNTYLLYFI